MLYEVITPVRSVRDTRYKLIVNGNAGEEFRNNITARDAGGYYGSWRVAGDVDEFAGVVGKRHSPDLV